MLLYQAPASDPKDADFDELHDEAWSLWVPLEKTSDRIDGEATVSHYRQTLALTSDPQSRITVLHDTGRALSHLSSTRGDLALLSDAIACAREALALTPPGHEQRVTSLDCLGRFLNQRFLQTFDMDDITEAINCINEVILLHSENHPDRKVDLIVLGMTYQNIYNFNQKSSYLKYAINCLETALALCSNNDDKTRVSILSHLTEAYCDRDRDSAIRCAREALHLTPPGSRERLTRVNNLATIICARFVDFGYYGDLVEALALKEEAYSRCDEQSIFYALVLSNLADGQAAYLHYWDSQPHSMCVFRL